MRNIFCLSVLISVLSVDTIAQSMFDNFEGTGNISTWQGDDCAINTSFNNPFIDSLNASSKVLFYSDKGGLYANVRFDWSKNFNLSENSVFTLKIYVPSSGLTGSQNLQLSLKLQDGKLPEPWSTQSEIIKPIIANQWQTLSFDFAKDNYINLNGNSLPPAQRADFNRIVLQVNGENNTDEVIAYIDDFNYSFSKYTNSRFNTLIWSDEFDSNGALDTNKWYHQTLLPNGNSWFNGEIQHYTNRTANTIQHNGVLNIIAKKENFTDQGITKTHTSARLNSKMAFKYGRLEFRAKLPSGAGTWPALWLLGKNIDENGAYWDNKGFGTTPWPACGEIDVMEHWGQNQNYVQSAMHTPSSFGATVNLGGQTIATASTAFHVYALEWTEEKMVFSVDSVNHYTYQPSERNASTWPFDAEQYILMNFAIQGNISNSFSQDTLEIDYVRLYQEQKSTVTEVQKHEIEVYPNPVSDVINIHCGKGVSGFSQVTIYSNDGCEISSDLILAEDGVIVIRNLSTLSSGVYCLQYTLAQQVYTIRFIKE